MRDSLHWTPMNRRAKFDADSFIFDGEIRNRTYTNKQTVNDISTRFLSVCVAKMSTWLFKAVRKLRHIVYVLPSRCDRRRF